MSKGKVNREKGKIYGNNKYLVFTKYPENYTMFDLRANKPICFKDDPTTGGNASMVLQELDTLDIPNKLNGKKHDISYFAPNNVGILLSIANKSLAKAKKLFEEFLCLNTSTDSSEKDKPGKDAVINRSKLIYDYIELIQSCIVFGYTALEAFSNLSIPNDYEFKTEPNGKGIIEIYNKEAVERWTPLKVKISDILVNIYSTKSIKGLKIWNNFLMFEELRHEIIHQKTITNTNFYKKYFKRSLFETCSVAEEIIRFFFDNREDKKTTNSLWPWVINGENEFPVSYRHLKNIEVIGNIYEGVLVQSARGPKEMGKP